MKVAYILNSPNSANYKVGEMILPQLESASHGVEVVGIFFFDDNTMLLQAGNPKGERLSAIAKEKGILLMMCDQCADQRGLEDKDGDTYTPRGTVDGVTVGLLSRSIWSLIRQYPDQVISLWIIFCKIRKKNYPLLYV